MRLTYLISALLLVMVFDFLPLNDAFARGRGSGGKNGPGGACYSAETAGCSFALDNYQFSTFGDNWLWREPYVFSGIKANFKLTYVQDPNKGWMCANDTLTAGCNANGIKLTALLSGSDSSGLPPDCGMWTNSIDVPCLNTSIGSGFATTPEIDAALEESLEDQFPCEPDGGGDDCGGGPNGSVDIECNGFEPGGHDPSIYQVTCMVPVPFASRCRNFYVGYEVHLTHNSNAAALPDVGTCGEVDASCISEYGYCPQPTPP